MLWYAIPLLISLAGLVFGLHALRVFFWRTEENGDAREIRWGWATVGALVFLVPLLVAATIHLVLENRAKERYAEAQFLLDLYSIEAEIPDTPALFRHEDSNSAVHYRQIGGILEEHPETAELLARPAGQAAPGELLQLAGVPEILEHLQAASEKVRFWHASPWYSADPQLAFGTLIRQSAPLLLARARDRAAGGDTAGAWADLARALRLSAQLCGSPVYWQREAGEELLGQSLDQFETMSRGIGSTAPVPPAVSLERVREELQAISTLRAFDESVLRSLVHWDSATFERPQAVGATFSADQPDPETAAAAAVAAVAPVYMPLAPLDLPLTTSHTVLREQLLSAISQLHDNFHEQPSALARADLLSHLDPVIAPGLARALAERLQQFQDRVLQLETRRRLAEAATLLYLQAQKDPADYLRNPAGQLQQLPRENLLHPRTFALLTVSHPGSDQPVLAFGDPAGQSAAALWQLAPAAAIRQSPSAQTIAKTADPAEQEPPTDLGEDRAPLRSALFDSTQSRRQKLLTAARLLQRQKSALDARRPDPATASPEELDRWQQDLETWKTQATRLKQAASEM